MTRYAELSRKAESLWMAHSNCSDPSFAITLYGKWDDLRKTLYGLSIDQADQSATDRRNHVLSAVGLTIVESTGYRGDAPNPALEYSLHDSSTGLPVTWGELIERMNGR